MADVINELEDFSEFPEPLLVQGKSIRPDHFG